MLPAATFPREIRSSCNGISAACGKLGAALGAAIFEPLLEATSLSTVLFCCTGVACCGWLVTHFYVGAEVDRADKQRRSRERLISAEDSSPIVG